MHACRMTRRLTYRETLLHTVVARVREGKTHKPVFWDVLVEGERRVPERELELAWKRKEERREQRAGFLFSVNAVYSSPFSKEPTRCQTTRETRPHAVQGSTLKRTGVPKAKDLRDYHDVNRTSESSGSPPGTVEH